MTKKSILEKHLFLSGYNFPECRYDNRNGWCYRFKTKDNVWTSWQSIGSSFDYALRTIYTSAVLKEWVQYSK